MTAASSQAGVIETDANYQVSQVAYYQTIAQSFIAEDSAIKFAFYFTPMNLDWPNTPMVVSLMAGECLGGGILATRSFTLATDFSGFFDADFSNVALLLGETYTASIDVTGDSPYWGVSSSERDYAGGTGYANDEVIRNHDWTFRVTPVAQSADVP